jgi:hypothetical protein
MDNNGRSQSFRASRPVAEPFPALALIQFEASGLSPRSWIMNGSAQSTVPYGADQAVYLIIDRFGESGNACRESEAERTDLETVITDLMSGQFNDPVRVVAFNTLEHWLDNISEEIALEIQTRCDIDGEDVPESIRDFVRRYTRPDRRHASGLAQHDRFDRKQA